MLLNGRLTATEQPEKPKLILQEGDYIQEASTELRPFLGEGYAASDAQVAENIVPDKSPLYSVEFLQQEHSVGETVFDEEIYIGRPVEDQARMQGMLTDAEEVIEALENGYVYLMSVAHASEPETEPPLRVAEKPAEASIRNSEAAVEALDAVEDAIEETEHVKAFPDYTLWTDSYSTPEEAVKQASGKEFKLASTLYTDTDFYIDVGFLSSPEEDGSEFGIEIRNKPSEPVTEDSMVQARRAVDEIVDELEAQGIRFDDKKMRMKL